jgi:outer membrane lipoprotein
MILRDFDTYQGRLVLMGGEIIETRNLEEATVIEVLQKPLGRGTDRPLENTQADGRFFIRYRTFKDPYVFKQGKEITVAGIVAGKEESKIDQKVYTYLILENKETYLWPERENYYDPYRYGYPYYPYWYPYYPWWYDPYYHPRRRYWP